MVAAEDAKGCTALHYACRALANSEKSASAEDINIMKEGAEEVVETAIGIYGWAKYHFTLTLGVVVTLILVLILTLT